MKSFFGLCLSWIIGGLGKPRFNESGLVESTCQNPPLNDRLAFTLAEVLITLGIIGVVAAMTMPVLISNHKKQVTVERLKKTYSVISHAVEKSKVDYGDIRDWDWDLPSDEFMDKYINQNLQITKNCGYRAEGCWSRDRKIFLLNGQDAEQIQGGNYSKVQLSDGTNVAMLNQNVHAHIYIDVNGDKAPNTYGIDSFILTLAKDAKYGTDDWGLTDVRIGGVYFFGYGYPRDVLKANCKRGADGRYCGQLLMIDGWKMSSDYMN